MLKYPAIAAFFLLLMAPSITSASTPDGETPAIESICDELQADGVTKGLYGLCVAFCEAQDAEVTCEDPADVDTCTFGENSRPSNPKILENYNKRMTASDPAMPCIVPAPSCPCWTEAELDAQPWADPLCSGPTSSRERWQIFLFPPNPLTAGVFINPFSGELACGFRDATFSSRFFVLSPDEYDICRNSIQTEMTELGLPCFP